MKPCKCKTCKHQENRKYESAQAQNWFIESLTLTGNCIRCCHAPIDSSQNTPCNWEKIS